MSTNPEGRAWVEVSADALLKNFTAVREAVGADVHVLPMVKADAYGVGVDRVVEALAPLGPWGFGVATVDEGLHLRSLGVETPVFVASPIPPGQTEEAVSAALHLSVSSLDALDQVRTAARSLGVRASAHVDVDTGMGRSGFDWRAVSAWAPCVAEAAAEVEWAGCLTHLHSADESLASVREQWTRFTTVLDALEPVCPGVLVHVLNSAGAFRAPEYARALVRPGIFLYGGRIGPGQPTPAAVVSVRARVAHVRDAPAGTTLGYGATHVAPSDERWATLAIGYGDGLPRVLGNRGSALLGGRRVPIVGRISMDVTVVDITDVPGVATGDVATLLGSDGDLEITVDEVAREAGTISYEVLTGLTARLPRVWVA